MSARRNTRATSSRAASPAPTNASTTSRRPARRAGNAQLPALNLRASTAYGTNTTPLMTGRTGHVPQQLNTVLQNLLPVDADEAGAPTSGRRGLRRGRAGNDFVDPNRTYGAENEIFGHANFDTSSISHHSDITNNNIHDEPEVEIQQPQPANNVPLGSSKPANKPHQPQHQPHPQPSNQQPRPQQQQQQPGGNYFRNYGYGRPGVPVWVSDAIDVVKQFSYFIARLFLRLWRLIFNRYGAIILAILLLAIFGDFRKPTSSIDDEVFARPDRPTGGYTIGLPDFSIPHWVKHPIDALLEGIGPDVVKDFNDRLKNTDLTIERVWKQVKFNNAALERLKEMLPDQVIVKKDKDGKLKIPHEIWEPLREVIRTDPEIQDAITSAPASDPADKSKTQKPSTKELAKAFDRFLDANRVKIATFSDEELTKKFPNLLRDNIIVAKPQIIEMLQKDWDDNRKLRQAELVKFQETLEQQQRQITKLGREPAAVRTEQQLKALVEKIVREMPGAQHGAGGANWGQTKINHWSHGTGAVVDPFPTSPNYQFPSMKQWLFAKTFRYVIGNPVPVPNPPEAALRTWDEHGDCWCTPAGGSDGYGASIGVISGSSIYPEQIVVEHIAPTASLEPGAAPKEMELWAYIHDFDTYDQMKIISREMFPPESRDVEVQQTMGYVRVATWTYDLESSDNIQAFPVQLDMKDLSAHTNKLIVRTKNNWGGGKVDYTCLYRVRVHGEIHHDE